MTTTSPSPNGPSLTPLPRHLIDEAVRAALIEDLGLAGDITSSACIPADARSVANLAARKAGIVSGLDVAIAAFHAVDPTIRIESLRRDGARVAPGDVIARIDGPSRSVLTAERVALNFMGMMSGIATATSHLVDAVDGTSAHITCTRKTAPGLRAFQKYAVRCGGGRNHRFGLFDAVMIKDNHIAACGSIANAIRTARMAVGHTVRVEVEVDRLDQLAEALEAQPDIVLLDNMSLEDLTTAVAMASSKVILEASGNVTIDTVAGIARTGVDVISSGWITHSAPTLDLGLDFVAS